MVRGPAAASIGGMPTPRPIHVLPHKLGSWSVQREGDEQPLSEHGNATAAEQAATHDAAAEAQIPPVLVHDRYERVHQAPQPPLDVLIAGGGPAALEAALTLHRLAGTHVTTTVLAPDTEFTYRPLSVLAPFAAGAAPGYPLARIAADAGFTHRRGSLASVDADGHAVLTHDGERIGYDVLLVAAGAVAMPPLPGVTAFTGSAADEEAVHGLVQDVEGGHTRRVAFVVPEGSSWPLPLYELALMLAARAFEMCVDLELHFVTPECAPLEVFGAEAAREVGALLKAAGIVLHTETHVDRLERGRAYLAPGADALDVLRVITLPHLDGPAIAGLPCDAAGFLVTDVHGRVTGVPNVYAAGDITAFAVKQGGIACQQADAAAEHIAARAGAAVEPEPFTPVLRGMLLTQRWARFLRRDAASGDDDSAVAGRALWWPPSKIAGRELAAYLERLDEDLGRVRGLPVDRRVDVNPPAVEILSLH
jgi:sulfide:quinone oxidoreductase